MKLLLASFSYSNENIEVEVTADIIFWEQGAMLSALSKDNCCKPIKLFLESSSNENIELLETEQKSFKLQ